MIVSARAMFALSLVLVLSACGVRYVYTQLDWIVPWYVRDYVTLDRAQRALLDARLSRRLDWHCRSQVPAYSDWLRRAAAAASSARADHEEIDALVDQAEAFVRELMESLAEDVPNILTTLSDEQVNELFNNLEERNERIRKEYFDAPAGELRALQVARMEKRLRRWFGRLTGEQRRLVETWSTQLAPIAEEWFANRIAWQRQLHAALQQRHARPAFDGLIAELMIDPDSEWSAEYRDGLARNRSLTLNLLADIHAVSLPRQRTRLIREIDSLMRQFDRVACNAEAPVAPPTPVES